MNAHPTLALHLSAIDYPLRKIHSQKKGCNKTVTQYPPQSRKARVRRDDNHCDIRHIDFSFLFTRVPFYEAQPV